MAQKNKSPNIKLKDLLNATNGGTLILLMVLFLWFLLIIVSPTFSNGGIQTELSNIVSRDHDSIIYLFSTLYSESVLMAFAGMVIGIISFWYLTGKEKCTALLSSPVKRKTIYLNRLVPPIVGLLLAGLIPKLIAYGINISHCGFSKELLLCILTDALCLIAAGLFPYTCCAVGFTFTKTRIEAIVTSISLFTFIFWLSNTFSVFFDTFIYGYADNIFSSDFFAAVSDPILTAPVDVFEHMLKGSYYKSFIPAYLIYIAVSVVLLVVCSKAFQKGFRIEDIGKTNNCKPITVLTLVSICFGVITFVSHSIYSQKFITTDKDKVALIACVIITAVIVSFIANAILIRKIKKVRPAVICCGICCAILGTCCLWCLSDGFGFYSQPPKAEDIREASFSAPFYEFYPQGYDYDNFCDFQPYSRTTIKLKEPESIEKLIQAHKTITENKKRQVSVITYISYATKDGKIQNYKYELVSREACNTILELWETPEVKGKFKEILLPTEECIKQAQAHKEYGYCYVDFDEPVSITSKYNCTYDLSTELSANQKRQLCRAIYEDILSMSAEDYFTPTNTQTGYITFTYNNTQQAGKFNFCISDTTPETLKLIKEYGLWDKLTKTQKITSMYCVETDDFYDYFVELTGNHGFYDLSNYIHSPVFSVKDISLDMSYTATANTNDSRIKYVTDTKEQRKLLEKSYFWYYAGNEGTLVHIVFEDGEFADYFIP